MPLTSAIKDLADRPDCDLFPLVSEGIGHITAHIERLHESAQYLADAGDHTSTAILETFAVEEAAKVLILLDLVRCPRSKGPERQRVLGRWHSHLWKGLYSEMCYLGMTHHHFSDVEEFIERESALFYLDGPIGVDWIFPNEILNRREGSMYVDYVRDVTQGKDELQWWSTPTAYEQKSSDSPCLHLVSALVQLGVTTVQGLEIVADVWRTFDPEPHTSMRERFSFTNKMLLEMQARGVTEVKKSDTSLVNHLSRWPFPLWSLDQPNQNARLGRRLLHDIRQERKDRLKLIRKIERVREPAVMISETKVHELHEAYAAYDDDRRKHEDKYAFHTPGGLRLVSAVEAVTTYDEQSTVYRDLMRVWSALSKDERIELAALAIFTRGQVADWASSYEDAKRVVTDNDQDYEMHLCGASSLKGLLRYQTEPPRRI